MNENHKPDPGKVDVRAIPGDTQLELACQSVQDRSFLGMLGPFGFGWRGGEERVVDARIHPSDRAVGFDAYPRVIPVHAGRQTQT